VISESEDGDNESRLEEKAPFSQAEPQKSEQRSDQTAATPLAKRVADNMEVNLSEVSGSGIGGRVTKEDVQRYIQEQEDGQKAARSGEPNASPGISKGGEERVRMSRRRRTIANTLVSAQQTTASLTTFNEVDMNAIMDLRKRRNPSFQEQHGVKLGIASFFIKSAVAALKAFPRLNAEIDGDEIILKSHYDIGVAIGDEDGLVVPVLRDADRKSFAEIEKQIDAFIHAVREQTLAIEDLRGGTFSVTNGGVYGSLLSTPILNPPQVGILGLHKIEPRPVVKDNQVVIRSMMYVALTYDHRIVDGREAVQFLVKIKNLVEDPEQLLLAG
jgi:2-oxoglutarate dehydrogenase E2 component (dihydrolipoamide succinyltransferase)